MKKFFLSLVAMMIATVSFAQNTLVATLTHGDEISMYYGIYAYQNAMKAAVDGDVINLSGGVFESTNITKSVTIRGTGINDANPTYIRGGFSIEIKDSINRLTIEGVRINNDITAKGQLNNAYFVKDYVSRFTTSGTIKNATFANCEIANLYIYSANSSLQCINSIINIYSMDRSCSSTSSATFVNCVLTDNQYYSSYYVSMFMNCIFSNTSSTSVLILPSSATVVNCVSTRDIFGAIIGKNNKIADLSIFKDSNPYNDLTDEAKATYLGTDGTPVGIYGGALPYNTTPSYPQITKMNVANKTTADGKLSVEIEVSAAQ